MNFFTILFWPYNSSPYIDSQIRTQSKSLSRLLLVYLVNWLEQYLKFFIDLWASCIWLPSVIWEYILYSLIIFSDLELLLSLSNDLSDVAIGIWGGAVLLEMGLFSVGQDPQHHFCPQSVSSSKPPPRSKSQICLQTLPNLLLCPESLSVKSWLISLYNSVTLPLH